MLNLALKVFFSFLNIQEEIVTVDLEKPLSGGLGFSVIGGERGIFVKSITPGGIADASDKLQIGDRLLKVRLFFSSFFLNKPLLSELLTRMNVHLV